jgi:trehalose 6-phosphate synthase/phosphatase
VDRLDPSKGLEERLNAYRELLRQHPKLKGTIVMVMIVAPSRTDIAEYAALKKRLDHLLSDIALEFGERDWQPVDFIFRSVPLDAVMHYYQVADVAFIAPLRDGMNLVAKEYLASNPNGVLILSETAGAAEELQDAIQVDPTDIDSLVKGLYRALHLPKRELTRRARHLRQHIKTFTVQAWASSFIATLQRPTQAARAPLRNLTTRRARYVRAEYHQANKRLLLLDYDGVLREFVSDPQMASPSPQVRALLHRLGSNPANEVVIISGRSKHDLQEWFGDLPLALAAEHGAFFKRRDGKNWHRATSVDPAWQAEVKELFTDYVALTPGSRIEQKDAALVWHYRTASPFHAQKNLVGLRRQLKPLLKRYALSEKPGHKVLEVHPSDVNKGRAAQEWLLHDFDFVLAMGDDTTDEDMFKALPPGGHSIKVGFGPSAAQYRLSGVAEVLRFLETL